MCILSSEKKMGVFYSSSIQSLVFVSVQRLSIRQNV